MKKFAELSRVRIADLYGPVEAHLALTHCPRLPVVGDVGIIVQILSADGRGTGDPDVAGTRFLVESVAPDGGLNWLAEFSSGELELVDP